MPVSAAGVGNESQERLRCLQRFIDRFFVQVFTQERKAARPRGEGSPTLWKRSCGKQQLRKQPHRAPGPSERPGPAPHPSTKTDPAETSPRTLCHFAPAPLVTGSTGHLSSCQSLSSQNCSGPSHTLPCCHTSRATGILQLQKLLWPALAGPLPPGPCCHLGIELALLVTGSIRSTAPQKHGQVSNSVKHYSGGATASRAESW